MSGSGTGTVMEFKDGVGPRVNRGSLQNTDGIGSRETELPKRVTTGRRQTEPWSAAALGGVSKRGQSHPRRLRRSSR